MDRTTDQLVDALRADHDTSSPDLAAIRRGGARRRRRTLWAGAGAGAVVVGLTLGVTVVVTGHERAVDPPSTAAQRAAPPALSPLASRAVKEIPGAVQVSSWQVVLPGPGVARTAAMAVGRRDMVVTSVDLGLSTYSGVTSYPRSAFPGWLWDGVAQAEEAREDGEGAQLTPDGFDVLDQGIVVESGRAVLACVSEAPARTCSPALLSRTPAGLTYEAPLAGGDNVGLPGSSKGAAVSEDFSGGVPGHLVVATLGRTGIAGAEVVTADGATVPATVESDTVMPAGTVVWAKVGGTVDRIAYRDAAGSVVDSQPLGGCTAGEDCTTS